MLSSSLSRAALLAALLATCLPACKDKPDAPRLIAEAQAYQKKGDSKAAVIQLKNVLQANPEHTTARALLGDFYLEGGDVPSAEKEYRRARQAGMADADILPRLARVMLLQQQFEAVLATLPDKPPSAHLMAWRAYALLGLNRRAEASQFLEAALAREEGNRLALLGQARLALLENDAPRALALADRTLARHPEHVDALRFRADLLRVQGKPAEARASYEQILKLRPADLQTRIDIASLLIQDGKYADAKAQLARARAISPASLPLVFTQALLDFREQRYSGALEQLQLVLRAAPEYMPAVLLTGAVQYELNNNVQAEQHLRHFLENLSGHLYGSKLLAATLLRNGKPAEAVALLGPLIEKHPQDAELLAASGDAHMRLQQFGKAADEFQKAVELAPSAVCSADAPGASSTAFWNSSAALPNCCSRMRASPEVASSSASCGCFSISGPSRATASAGLPLRLSLIHI